MPCRTGGRIPAGIRETRALVPQLELGAPGELLGEEGGVLGRHHRETRPVAHVLEHLAEPGPALAPQPVEAGGRR